MVAIEKNNALKGSIDGELLRTNLPLFCATYQEPAKLCSFPSHSYMASAPIPYFQISRLKMGLG